MNKLFITLFLCGIVIGTAIAVVDVEDENFNPGIQAQVDIEEMYINSTLLSNEYASITTIRINEGVTEVFFNRNHRDFISDYQDIRKTLEYAEQEKISQKVIRVSDRKPFVTQVANSRQIRECEPFFQNQELIFRCT